MSQGCAVNAARHKAESFGTCPRWFLDWCIAVFGFQFPGLVPSGWACLPSNAGNVPSLPSCSLSCVLGGRNVALLKGILGFIVVMR